MMYAVIEWGGGLCPSCKIQRGGLCPSCKIHRGDYVLVVKFMGGILSTYTKMSRGGFVREGFCPTLDLIKHDKARINAPIFK